MAETIRKIFPGNVVNYLNAYGKPNASFTTNARPVGSPQDRQHQGAWIMPGWVAVHKVGYALVGTTVATSFDFTIPSPDTASDKARADIAGLLIPSGSILYRIGFRILPTSKQPGFVSQGPRAETTVSGITGTATDKLTLASATPAASAGGSIAAGAVTTGTDGTAVIIPAGGAVPVGQKVTATAFGSPVVTNTDLTLKLYSVATGGTSAGSGISSTFTGGCYVIAEACYLVPDTVPELDSLRIPGVKYSGYTS